LFLVVVDVNQEFTDHHLHLEAHGWQERAVFGAQELKMNWTAY